MFLTFSVSRESAGTLNWANCESPKMDVDLYGSIMPGTRRHLLIRVNVRCAVWLNKQTTFSRFYWIPLLDIFISGLDLLVFSKVRTKDSGTGETKLGAQYALVFVVIVVSLISWTSKADYEVCAVVTKWSFLIVLLLLLLLLLLLFTFLLLESSPFKCKNHLYMQELSWLLCAAKIIALFTRDLCRTNILTFLNLIPHSRTAPRK